MSRAIVRDVLLLVLTVAGMRRMNHIWPGQHWPMSMTQETACISELRERAGAPGVFDRDDVTAMMGILRCGSPWDRALELAPGLNLPALLGAYEKLATELEKSRRAWADIVKKPEARILVQQADIASRLLPVPVHRALFAMEDAPTSLPAVMHELDTALREAHRAARLIEEKLEAHVPPSPSGVTVGAKLFSPTAPGVYADPFYLADRVSALSPVRVAELLGTPLAE